MALVFGIGGTEILILIVLFLVIFGPEKLTHMSRDLGKFIGEARRQVDAFKDELNAEHEEAELRRREASGHRDADEPEHVTDGQGFRDL